MRKLFILFIGSVFFLGGCIFDEEQDLIVRESPELIHRWDNDIQPGIEPVLIELSQISKVSGEYSLTDETAGDYELLKVTDKSGGYIARAEVYKTGQVNAMPYELTWEARTGEPLPTDETTQESSESSSGEFADVFFVGDDHVSDEMVSVFFEGDM